jgi:hypothetical protein
MNYQLLPPLLLLLLPATLALLHRTIWSTTAAAHPMLAYLGMMSGTCRIASWLSVPTR